MNITYSFQPTRRLSQRIAVYVALLVGAMLTTTSWAAGPFTVNPNGTVTDSSTSLVWDQCTYGLTGSTCSGGTALQGNWSAALAAVVTANSASYKGFTDWRLPNKNELMTLAITDNFIDQFAFDKVAFPTTPISYFWTSTTYAPSPSDAWVVNFDTVHKSKMGSYHLRLVRGGQVYASFDSLKPIQLTQDQFTAQTAGLPTVLETFNGYSTGPQTSPFVTANGTYTGTPDILGLLWCHLSQCMNSNVQDGTFSGFPAGTTYWGAKIIPASASYEIVQVTVTGNSGSQQFNLPFDANGNSIFVGFSDPTGLQSVAFHIISGGYNYAFDDVITAGLAPTLAAPICTLSANPVSISVGDSSTLTVSCDPTVTSYTWSGGTCGGTTASSCTVTPATTITYSVTGANAAGASTASATVTVAPVNYIISGTVVIAGVVQAGAQVDARWGTSGHVLCTAATGVDGSYSCSVPSTGTITITASQSGYAFQTISRNNVASAETGASIQGVALVRSITGAVKDAAGNPLSGINVSWFGILPGSSGGSPIIRSCGFTVADGVFTCNVPQGFTGSVNANFGSGQTYAFVSLSRTNLVSDETGANIVGIALVRTIAGTVKDGSGNLLSGVQVNWNSPSLNLGGYCGTTAADGAYTCHVPDGFTGTVTAYASATGTNITSTFTNVTADLTGQAVAPVNYAISGTVVVAGVVHAGAQVDANWGSSGHALCTAATGADGSYSCSVPNTGAITITATHAGHAFQAIYRSNVASAETGASIRGVALARSMAGAVKDAIGNPLSGVSVTWQSSSSNGFFSGSCGTTGATGSYSCNVPAGQVWVLGSETGYVFVQIYRANLLADETSADMLGMALVRGITGTVKDANGVLLSGVNVNWYSPPSASGGSSFSGYCGTTLADGIFTCHVPQGFTGSVNANFGNGQTYAFVSLSRANLVSDETGANIVGIALVRSIGGTVKDGSGNLLSGALVNWNSPSLNLGGYCGTTAADGAYTCHVPDGFTGTVTAYASATGTNITSTFANVTADLAGQTVAAVNVSISGTVVVGGVVHAGTQVDASWGSSGHAQCTVATGADGSYSCSVPNTGSITITATQAGYVFQSLSRSNLASAETGASIQGAALARSMAGTVKDASGNPLSGANITWQSWLGSKFFSGTCGVTGANGSYSCSVPGGQVWIIGSETGYAFVQLSRSNLVSDETGADMLGAALVRSIAGTVKDASGNILSGVSVSWNSPSSSGNFSGSCGNTPADGSYTCHVPQGFTGTVSVYIGAFNSISSSFVNVTADLAGQIVSPWSSVSVPGAPTGVTAIAGNGGASVAFMAPVANGGATISGYTVTSTPGGLTASGAASPIMVTGLSNGTSYTFTVVAANGAGAGTASAPSNAVSPSNASQIIGVLNFSPTVLTVGGTTTVSATATSGLAVSFSSTTPGVCTVSGSAVTGVVPGNCAVAANQAGDGTYSAAVQVTQNIIVVGNVAVMATGGYHSCALTNSGGVKCWGYNYYGQLGDNSTTNRLTAVDVSGLPSGVISIATGQYHSCALTSGGGVKCWGMNNFGQLGDNSTTNRLVPVDVTGLTSGVTAISAGFTHTCALITGGGIKCWGMNNYGQVGDNSTTNRLVPVDVTGLTSGVIAISAGSNHTCALTTGGGVKCWGMNSYAQLGDNSPTNRPTAVDVSGLTSGVISIAAGQYHSCALTGGGGVRCWGNNDYGQLGDSSATPRGTPVDVTGLTNGVIAIAAGANHSCAQTSGGVKCWGMNTYGQLGDNSTANRPMAVDVNGLTSGVISIAAGAGHTCALTSGDEVKCWGSNSSGQLGDGRTANRSSSGDVSSLTNGVISIATGPVHSCALTSGGGVKCWGINNSGQLGDNSTTNRLTPVDVTGLISGAIAISAGSNHTCALTTGGGVKCWGNNGGGQLGDNSTTSRLTPVDVSGLGSGVVSIAVGDYHTCALTSGGGVKCWGDDYYGQLGDNSTTNWLTPVDVSGLTSGVTAISAGSNHTCALTSGGGVKCWGYNYNGQLGDNSTTNRLTAVDVSGLPSGVISIATGQYHSCVLTSGGAVKCWGMNNFGQLGDNSTTNRLTAVDVSGLTSGAISIAAGQGHSCALTTGGGVKCWGRNFYGQLGDGGTADRLTPVDVSGLTSGVTSIAAGQAHSCALTTGGGMKCWGNNLYGQLGDGTSGYRSQASLPVQGFSTSILSSQSISFGSAPTLVVGGTGLLSATGGASGNAITFSSTTPGICTVAGSIVTGVVANTCVVAANQAGNANYSPAPQVTQNITVGPAPTTTTTTTTTSTSTTTTTTTSSTTTTTLPGPSISMVPSWNLAGNGYEAPITVASTFNDASKVTTVWKWVTTGNTPGITYPAWAFYTPVLGDGGQAYAASKGYEFLTTINAGEGFWVNAKTAFTVAAPTGAPVHASSFMPAVSSLGMAGGAHALPRSWSLIATGDNPTPTQFDAAISTFEAVPPAAGSSNVYTNLTTLWAWDASRSSWYFWAPSLVNSGGLMNYISGKGYLDFVTMPNTPTGTLSPATGFWVNMP